MKVTILSDTSIKGISAKAGRVMNIDKADARTLTSLGKAEPYIEHIEKEQGGQKPPAPKKRGRKKKDG